MIWPAAVRIIITPVTTALSDAETAVLLFLSAGSSGEGFLKFDPNGPQWRDVWDEPLDDGVVEGWADLPDKGRPETLDPDLRLPIMQAALKDACDLLDGWVFAKCPPRFRAEHQVYINKLRKAGQL